MPTKTACPRCGDRIDEDGYCVNSECVYSFEKTTEKGGPKVGPFSDD